MIQPLGFSQVPLSDWGRPLLLLICSAFLWWKIWKGIHVCQVPLLCLLRWWSDLCSLVYQCGVLHWFQFSKVNQSCIPGYIPLDNGVKYFLHIAGLSLQGFCWGFLLRDFGLWLSFLWCLIWYAGNTGLTDWEWKYSLLEEFIKDWC